MKILLDGEEHNFREGMTVDSIMRQLGLDSELYLPVKEGRLVPPDYRVKEGDVIEFRRVSQGG